MLRSECAAHLKNLRVRVNGKLLGNVTGDGAAVIGKLGDMAKLEFLEEDDMTDATIAVGAEGCVQASRTASANSHASTPASSESGSQSHQKKRTAGEICDASADG